ncbi:MAG: protoporphyrinogen oxidase HemJ [Gluconacetobacter diazotrophicus]|nr:protoporphyrinogen oxidase HemJ [Gluconacetobacter diazotrophicus]
MGYLWLKVVHILAVISWMVGMLYMPRLFVYHAEAGPGSPQAATFAVMERRLQKAIMLPALIVTWITGLWLAYWHHFFLSGWLHGKLLLVVLLTGVHGFLAAERKKLAAGTSRHDSRFFRIVNEVPTVLLIGIVILVVVKPF